MGFTLKPGDKNVIPKGTVIFSEKEPVSCMCAVLAGRVSCSNDYLKIPIVKGGFVGAMDIVSGRYMFEYTAEEDTILFPFEAKDVNALKTVFASLNKDYRGLVIGSGAKFITDMMKIRAKYIELSGKLYNTLIESYEKYNDACRNGGMPAEEFSDIEDIRELPEEEVLDEATIARFTELNAVPSNVLSAFYGNAIEMTMEQIIRLSKGISELSVATERAGNYVHDYYLTVYNDGEKNLLNACVTLSKDLDKAGRADKSLSKLCETLSSLFRECEDIALFCMGASRPVNRDRLEKILVSLESGEEVEESEGASAVADEDLYRSLRNSMKAIITFGKVDKKIAQSFEESVNAFIDSKDRFSTEDAGRQMRRKVAEHFYDIYLKVFETSIGVKALPKPVELFLNFGYVDERLITKEQAIELCKLNLSTKKKYCCNLYTLPEWLTAVYTGKREPSKNEFDLEYNETLREMKKMHEIDDEEEKRRLKNPTLRLEFEVKNMFKLNQRVVNGQPSVFVPILCSEQMTNGPMKAVVTKDRIGQLVNKYRDLDIGVFRREQMYANAELGIEKEIIQLEVFPDIVLMPAYGTNASMWQEISCKKRDSSGRFLFPAMLDGSLDDLVIRILGRFRWELCRTMQGTAWNNIQFKSLTSEFSDYIQFYKKNRDLSDEKKEKIKTQLVKGKNNAREVFVQDYEQWLKSESQGGQKLNKTSRDILALYCPFDVETRKKLETQPAFADAIARYNREAQKKAHELELRHHNITKKGTEVPAVMLDTLKFYKEM